MKRLFSVLLFIVCLLPVSSEAARLFTNGFEEGTLVTTTTWSTVGANTTAVTTTPHSGSYSGQSTSTANKAFTKALDAAVSSGTYYPRFYWQTNATGVGDSRIFRDMSGGSVSGLEIYKLSTGAIRLANAVASTTVDSSLTVSINTIYRFAAKHVISDTVGYLVLNIYLGDATSAIETLVLGASDANGTGANADTLPTTILSFSFEESLNSGSLTYLWDDIAINDSTGSFQTSYPGPGKIYLLTPDSNVAMMWEDESAPLTTGGEDSATFNNIDDLPGAINDADYNMADPLYDANDTLANDPIDRLGLTNLGAEVPADAVLSVITVLGRIGSNQTSAANLRYKLWDEVGTITNGASINANVNGWKITTSAAALTYNASAKTKANVDSFNVGYEVMTDTLVARPRRVSALWALVEWIEATASGTILQQNSGFLPAVIR